jgi:hypothetical protein
MIPVRAWARALAGGRRRIVGRWPGASMVLAIKPFVRHMPSRRHRVVHHHHHRHDHRHVDRRVDRRVNRRERLVAGVGHVFAPARRTVDPATARTSVAHAVARRRPVVAARSATAAVSAMIPRRRVVPSAETTGLRRTAATIGAAHRRVETFSPPRLIAAPVSPERGLPVPPQRQAPATRPAPTRTAPATVRGPAMVVRPVATAPTPVAAVAEVPGRALTAARGPGSAPAELDIEQLTERVVRQIDRRIVAHRERLGRI